MGSVRRLLRRGSQTSLPILWASTSSIIPMHKKLPSSRTIVGPALALAVVTLMVAIATIRTATTFKACFGIFLSVFAIVQIYAGAAFIMNRTNSLLQLSQPVGLSLFAFGGAAATMGSFTLALPEYDIACALRQPIILSCITLMGATLASRSWRLALLVCPKLGVGRSKGKAQMARRKVLHGLRRLRDCTRAGTRCSWRSVQGNKSLREQVTLADSIRVTTLLMLPQIILQIINLAVPGIRMHSVWIEDGVYTCRADTGPLMLVIGILFTALPFILALILNIKSEWMPDVFIEYSEIATSMRLCCGMLVATLPSISMTGDLLPDVKAYLYGASVLSFVLPLSYQIAWVKLQIVTGSRKSDDQKQSDGERKKITIRRLPSYESTHETEQDSLEVLKAAEDASTMSRMFETMGNVEKSLAIDLDILSMFKKDAASYLHEDGFTESEIKGFGPKALEVVVATLISNAKHLNALMPSLSGEEKEICTQRSAKSCLRALQIFDICPAKQSLTDRRVVFPGYSFYAVLIKAGNASAPGTKSITDHELEIGEKFIRETQFNLSPYCRALALQSEFLANQQRFDDALTIVKSLRHVYHPRLHSKSIVGVYATDHAANIISLSALWLDYLERTEEALEHCSMVIQNILPAIKDPLGLTLLLIPAIRVLISQGCDGVERAFELYNKHLVESYYVGDTSPTHASLMVLPMNTLLKCLRSYDSDGKPLEYEGMENDVQWMLNTPEKANEWTDTFYLKCVYSGVSSFASEACLELAKREIQAKQRGRLVEEGLRLCKLLKTKLTDSDGKVSNPIAHSTHLRVSSDLESMLEVI